MKNLRDIGCHEEDNTRKINTPEIHQNTTKTGIISQKRIYGRSAALFSFFITFPGKFHAFSGFRRSFDAVI